MTVVGAVCGVAVLAAIVLARSAATARWALKAGRSAAPVGSGAVVVAGLAAAAAGRDGVPVGGRGGAAVGGGGAVEAVGGRGGAAVGGRVAARATAMAVDRPDMSRTVGGER